MLTVEDYELDIKALSDSEVLEWDWFNSNDRESGRSWVHGVVGLTNDHPQYDTIMKRLESLLTRSLNRIEKAA